MACFQNSQFAKKIQNPNDKLQFIVESLVKHFAAKFARVWLLDKERKNLILKFSAGKYKNIDGEFSKVSANSNKIGNIVITGSLQLQMMLSMMRIRYLEWAKMERLHSFAGYPLTYGDVLLVLFQCSVLKDSKQPTLKSWEYSQSKFQKSCKDYLLQ